MLYLCLGPDSHMAQSVCGAVSSYHRKPAIPLSLELSDTLAILPILPIAPRLVAGIHNMLGGDSGLTHNPAFPRWPLKFVFAPSGFAPEKPLFMAFGSKSEEVALPIGPRNTT